MYHAPVPHARISGVLLLSTLFCNIALHHGKHQRTLALPSYVMTVTLYVTPADLKQELNQQFRERSVSGGLPFFFSSSLSFGFE